MTTTEKIAAVTMVALQQHAPFLDDPKVAVRSMSLVIKITPSGDVRAVICQFESEQNYNPNDHRGMPGEPTSLPPLAADISVGAPSRPPTMGAGKRSAG